MTQSKLSGQINPEVMQDMLSAQLPSKLKFKDFTEIDNTLVGVPGDTITIPSENYVGEAVTVAEGEPMPIRPLTTERKTYTVKKAGLAIELTNENMESAFGNVVDRTYKQLEKAILDKVDSDCVTVLTNDTGLIFDAKAQISYDAIVDAVDLFGDEDDEPKVLFIHPNQKKGILKSAEYLSGVEDAFTKGVIGEIAGVQVISSSKVPFDDTTNTYSNFIIKEGALKLVMKRSARVERDRDVITGSDVIAGNQHYVVVLNDESKAVKLITTT